MNNANCIIGHWLEYAKFGFHSDNFAFPFHFSFLSYAIFSVLLSLALSRIIFCDKEKETWSFIPRMNIDVIAHFSNFASMHVIS